MAKSTSKPTGSLPGDPHDPPKPEGGLRRMGPPSGWVLLFLLLAALLLLTQSMGERRSEITYSFFHDQVVKNNVLEIEIRGQQAFGEFRVPPLKSEFEASRNQPPAENSGETADQQASETATPEQPPAAGQEDSSAAGEESAEPQSDDPKPATDDPPAEQPPVKNSTDAADVAVTVAADGEEERLEKKFVVTLLSQYVDNDMSQFWMDHGVEVKANPPTDYSTFLYALWLGILVAFMVGMWIFFRRSRDQLMGGGMLGGVTRSPARRYENDGNRTTFDDVAGLRGVKRDLTEVVEFLKDPVRFQRLGARVPKGVLLMGPPGTGKTLLAKAVAGEAGVPFFSISGSEFIQMFVGVGAGRVRDLFKTAKAAAPAIIFIDEIDAVGRQRGAGLGGGHDEREQTLNQILSEMDGFTPTTSLIVIAATNRPDVLDPALLRPGRFDRHITVDRPSLEARRELFDVHTREMPIAEDVDFDRLARATVGLTGADIRNLANEAALWATRHGENNVDMSDFEYARDKVLMGAKRDDVLTEEERRITAYHEAGHTLLAWFQPGSDRVHKVTIIPRGRSLGVTQLVPEEDRHNLSQHDIHARLAMLLGGRTAEKIAFDEYSAGAENDLKEATKLARRMVTMWGMSERLGPVAFLASDENPFLGREIVQEHKHYSEHTAQIIDEEVAKILHAAADRAKRTLIEHSDRLTALSEALLEREVLDEDEIESIIGPPVHRLAEEGGAVMSKPPSSPVAPSPARRREA